MNDRARRSLAKYIFSIAKEFGLRDWDLYLMPEKPPDEEAAASVRCVYGRRKANIYIGDDFWHSNPEEQRRIILHELIHVHQDQTLTLVEETLPDLLGKPAMFTFEKAYRQANEHGVDALAAAIADRYPLWEGK